MSLIVLIVYFVASLALDNFMCLVYKPFLLSTSVLTGHAYKIFEWNRLFSFYIFHYLSVVSLSRPSSLSLSLSHTQMYLYFLTESSEFQEYTEELYKKNLNDPDNHDCVITHLEPDILECEVKWALGSITMNKASGDNGIPAKIFQILKHDAVKVLHSICQQIWKMQQWPQDWKRSAFIPIPKKGNAEECSSYHTIALISHASKVMLKILQDRLKQCMN